MVQFLVVVLALAIAGPVFGAERTFLMGFTPFPYDVTDEAQIDTYRRIGEHADLVGHHLDTGVPWPELAARSTYPKLVEDELGRRETLTPAEHTVYLAVTPISTLRDGVASYWSNHGPVDPPAGFRNFKSARLRRAYIRYCLDLIDRFQPRYLAYGVEVDILSQNDPAAFESFVKLARKVYRKLKRKHPDLPIFLTFTLGQPSDFDQRRAVMERLLPFSDILAISTYPYLAAGVDGDPAKIPRDWFLRLAQVAGDKPIAIAETGYAAETLVFETLDWTIPGNARWQNRYLEMLLNDANALEAEFIIWFVLVDYDKVWVLMEQAGVIEAFKAWRDTGLLDEQLKPRKSLRTWDRWLRRDRVPPP